MDERLPLTVEDPPDPLPPSTWTRERLRPLFRQFMWVVSALVVGGALLTAGVEVRTEWCHSCMSARSVRRGGFGSMSATIFPTWPAVEQSWTSRCRERLFTDDHEHDWRRARHVRTPVIPIYSQTYRPAWLRNSQIAIALESHPPAIDRVLEAIDDGRLDSDRLRYLMSYRASVVDPDEIEETLRLIYRIGAE